MANENWEPFQGNFYDKFSYFELTFFEGRLVCLKGVQKSSFSSFLKTFYYFGLFESTLTFARGQQHDVIWVHWLIPVEQAFSKTFRTESRLQLERLLKNGI